MQLSILSIYFRICLFFHINRVQITDSSILWQILDSYLYLYIRYLCLQYAVSFLKYNIFVKFIIYPHRTYQLNHTFRDNNNILGPHKSSAVYFFSALMISVFSSGFVIFSKVSSVNTTLFIFATFLMMPLASSCLFFDKSHLMDSGKSLEL